MFPTTGNRVHLRLYLKPRLFTLRTAFKIEGVSSQHQPGRMAAMSGITLLVSIYRHTVILHRIPAVLGQGLDKAS